MSRPKHKLLVKAAGKWLASRCSIVITEIATGAGEEPDAIGWQGSLSVLIECKASRADFLADRQKLFRHPAFGGLGNRRYYCSFPGIISKEEIPESWGLLEFNGRNLRICKEALPASNVNVKHEVALLISCLRRIGLKCPKGVSIKNYTYQTKNRATLGIERQGLEDYII